MRRRQPAGDLRLCDPKNRLQASSYIGTHRDCVGASLLAIWACVTPRDRLQASSYIGISPGLCRRQPAGDLGLCDPRNRLQASSYIGTHRDSVRASLLAIKDS
jgi:hypothetical protein